MHIYYAEVWFGGVGYHNEPKGRFSFAVVVNFDFAVFDPIFADCRAYFGEADAAVVVFHLSCGIFTGHISFGILIRHICCGFFCFVLVGVRKVEVLVSAEL